MVHSNRDAQERRGIADNSTEFAQPANFIIQIGLLATLRAAGVQPGAVVGHSVGELASAYAAGALTLRDALTVCFIAAAYKPLAGEPVACWLWLSLKREPSN